MELKTATLERFSEILKKANEPVLGIFFGTWCSYCQKNIPEIITYFDAIKANYLIYLVSVEETDPVWAEDSPRNEWNLNKVPTFRFYAPGTTVLDEREGEIKPKKLETLVKRHLNKK